MMNDVSKYVFEKEKGNFFVPFDGPVLLRLTLMKAASVPSRHVDVLTQPSTGTFIQRRLRGCLLLM